MDHELLIENGKNEKIGKKKFFFSYPGKLWTVQSSGLCGSLKREVVSVLVCVCFCFSAVFCVFHQRPT